MQITLVIRVGEVPVTFQLNNVREDEYIDLLQMLQTSSLGTGINTLEYDGGLSSLRFNVSRVEAVHVTRSQL